MTTTLIDRLKKRAADDEACAKNNEAVAEALLGQMRVFEEGKGEHNTYAVRMHLDHRNQGRKDRQYAVDLLEAIGLLENPAPESHLEGGITGLKPIPIEAAKRIAKEYGYDQVLIYARRCHDTPEPHGEHMTTYGRNREHCDVAARIGDTLKKFMGWEV